MAATAAPFGIIGGSGLVKSKLPMFADAVTLEVPTSEGTVLLRKAETPSGAVVYFVQRHKAAPSEAYAQPADINYGAIALALKKVGCKCVLGICSVGSLITTIPVGSFVVADDWYCPFDVRRVSSDYDAHYLPEIDGEVRSAVIEAVKDAGIAPVVAGTYINAKGPRFETKAEIRAFAGIGQILGMTAAHEATACGELKLRYGMLCVVDNMCHGVGAPFDLEAFHAAQDANRAALERVIELAVPRMETLASTIAAEGAPVAATDDGKSASSPPASEASASTGAATPFSVASTTAGSRRPVDLIVHARWVVPVLPHNMVFAHHAVVILNGLIVAVLPSHEATAKYEAARIIHKPRHAVMPGLVNCHTHLGMTALRGLGDDKPLFEWLSTAIWPTEGRLMSSEYVRAGVQMGLAEMIRGGTTCVNDMYFFPDVLAEELQRVGMRGCIGAPILEFPTAWAGSADEYLSKAEAVVLKARGDDKRGLLTYAISPHAPYTVADASFVKIKDAAERLDTRIHVHLHETKAEVEDSVKGAKTPNKHLSDHKCAPVTNLVRMGILSERTIAVHMANLSDEHLAEVADTGAHVVHCPHSNMKLASGFCRVAELMKAGVNVAIGTDSCASNNKLDMLGEMRTAAMLAKVVSSDPTAADAATALAMATINGAKAIGQEDRTGSLSVGKSADMIAVDLSEIESLPLYDVQSHLVYATDRNQVTDVWVNGTRLLAERKLTTIDYDACVASAHHWAKLVAPANETEEDAGESDVGAEAAASSSSS